MSANPSNTPPATEPITKVNGALVRTLRVAFDVPVPANAMSAFRGAIVEKIGFERELYHNHNNNSADTANFHYRYPLIQYVRRKGLPNILFINEAISEARFFFEQPDWNLSFRDQSFEAGLDRLQAEQFTFGHIGDTFQEYQLRNWLALNEANYERYKSLDRLQDQVALLDRILAGQLLGLATGLGIQFADRFEVHLTWLSSPRLVPYKGTHLLLFNARFRANLALPLGLGIGKGVSIGHGRVYDHRARSKNDQNQEQNG